MADPLRNFRRASVVEQTADLLEKAIFCGDLPDPLPGEFQLAERLSISRPTLRRALAILEKRGLILTAMGKRTRVLTREKTKTSEKGSVCFIVSAFYHPGALLAHPVFNELKLQLTAEGTAWDTVYESQLNTVEATARMTEVTKGRSMETCYVLFSPPQSLQQWFMSSGLPVLILGSCYEGIDLPSIDLDYKAVGWHAAGQFAKHGHRRVLLVKPMGAHPVGNTRTEEALREYLSQTKEGELRVLEVPNEPDAFLRAIGRALNGKNAPTALLACRVEIALSLLCSAPLIGRSIPTDLSLISRDYYPILETLTPRLTHYAASIPSFARKAVRFIHALLQGNLPSRKSVLLSPEFVFGQTLRDTAP